MQAFWQMLNAFLAGLRWSTRRRCDFYLMMAGFIADGKPVYDTMQVFEERWRNVGDKRAEDLANMMSAMRGRGGKALRLGQAIGDWAPTIESMAIDAGEQAGDLTKGLRMAAKLAQTKTRISSAIYGEIVYPAFLSLLILALLIAVKEVVLPVFSELAPRHLWPGIARMLSVLAENAVILASAGLFLAIGIAVAFHLTKGKWTGVTREVFDQWIPPWSMHRRVTGAIMMSCFSLFIQAGIPFSQVLIKLAATASDWEKMHLDMIKGKMRRGIRDGDAMAGSLFDEDIRWEIGVYGGMTSFSEALSSLSERVTERVVSRVQKASAFVRMLAMFGVAGMIIWIYGAFFAITMAAKSAAQ